MELTTVWFILIAVLWTGYLVLEGFDFGVGMLLGLLSRGDRAAKDRDRRVMINTIGPVWDGNEVWLLTAGGATFAAFPEWYATMFSGFYLPLLLILLALIVRVVAFEWRGKIDDPRWRSLADRCLMVGSWVPAVLWGVAFANLVRGVELDADHQYVGGFWALLNPFALLGGATTALIFLTHGAVFLALKSDGDIRARAGAFAARSSVVTLVVAGAWAVWAQVAYSVPWTWAPSSSRPGALVVARRRRAAPRGGPGVHRVRRGDRRGRGADLRLDVPRRHAGVRPGQLADRHQRVVDRLHAHGHDLGGRVPHAARAALPGLDVLGVPQADLRGPASPTTPA